MISPIRTPLGQGSQEEGTPKSSTRSLSPVRGRRTFRIDEEAEKNGASRGSSSALLHNDSSEGRHDNTIRDSHHHPNSHHHLQQQKEEEEEEGRGNDETLLLPLLDEHHFSASSSSIMEDPLQQQNNSNDESWRDQYRRHQEDEDDNSSVSSSSSASSVDSLGDAEDMKFSLCSNLLFLVGASMQTYIAVWDLEDAESDAATGSSPEDDGNNNNNNNAEFMDDFLDHDVLRSRIYTVLNRLGPLLFILNAIVDIKWAMVLPAVSLDYTTPPTTNGSEQEARRNLFPTFRGLPYWAIITRQEGTSLDNDISGKLWDLAVAFTFGLGALFEFYSTFIDDDDDAKNDEHTTGVLLAGYRVSMVSVHIYLISGLLTVHKERVLVCYPGGSKIRRLKACGMMLFLTGSINDVVLSYLYNPQLVADNIVSEVTLAWCNLCSTILWNTDAIFYVLADYLLLSAHDTWLMHPCHSTWGWLRQCVWDRWEHRSSLESLSVPFLSRRWAKADHRS